MLKRPFSHLLLLALGLMSAAILLWILLESDPDQGPIPLADNNVNPLGADLAPPPLAAAVSPRAELNPEAQALLRALQAALASGPQRPNEALLSFKNEAAMQRFLARARRNGLGVLDQSTRLRTVRVRYDTLSGLQNELAENPGDFEAISANSLFRVPPLPARQDRAELEHQPFGNDTLSYLGASVDRSNWGRGLTLAILDTGVSPDATFGANRVRALDLGLGLLPGTQPNDGHGTSVAALAAGMSPDAPGVAPAASLLSIRVTDTNGLSDLFTLSEAVIAATDAGARIINISLGGHATGPMLDTAISYAMQQGAVIVAAAGNDQAAQLAWPAADPRVISVGAIDRAEQQVIFSNAGAQLQFTAPGYGVQTAWLDGQRAYVNGTSASAPLVAGAIAAVMSQNHNLTAAQAVELLARTANDGGAPGPDPAYGRGIINLGTAMNSSNPAYVDTAVSSHYYDAATQQMQVVVQNRSGRSITGMSLNVQVGTTTTTQTLPTLLPGETYVGKAPVSQTAVNSASVAVTTHLLNPLGLSDQVPGNNRKATVLIPER